MWNDLGLIDKARMMQLAVKSGITDLRTIEEVYNTYASGGKIHIKPENRGKFTALKKRTGHSASWFKAHGTPAQKKMAVFALNARKWKHDDGGPLENENTELRTNEVVERRDYNGVPMTLEAFKQYQRDAIIGSAIEKALNRETGVAPIIEGKPQQSCIYTVTDNFGNKYKAAGNQTFMTNPEKYGFVVNGPVEDSKVGDIYQFIDSRGVPYHATLITGYDEDNNPLVSYSSGNAGSREFRMSEQDYYGPAGVLYRDNYPNSNYEDYLALVNSWDIENHKADYHKNKPLWSSYGYETYRFIGTPEDNERWTNEYNSLPEYYVLPKLNSIYSLLPKNIKK